MPITKRNTTIQTLEDWERLAGPKRTIQWSEARSAMESARAWLQGNGVEMPAEVSVALDNHPAFGKVITWAAEPEVQLRFDKFPGETRNSDLVVHAQDAHGAFLIAVEAKADEPFGETVGEALSAALERYLSNQRSNALVRAQQLARALLGPFKPGDPPAKDIRYQLLTACAGAMCEAERRGYSRAVMLIHEFFTRKTQDKNHDRNADDLNIFLRRISHSENVALGSGEIQGPFLVPRIPLITGDVKLFIGKVSRNVRHKFHAVEDGATPREAMPGAGKSLR